MIGFEFVDDVIRLHRMGWLGVRIAKRLGITPVMVCRILKQWIRLPDRRGVKGNKCKTCRTPTDGAQRCELHRRIHNAKLNRKAVRRYQKTQREKSS